MNMKQLRLQIGRIPAVLWGEPSDKLILAVHGSMSHKTDSVIALLAQHTVARGYQVLSFDLPEHGDRKNETTRCKAQVCVEELRSVMLYAKTVAREISLFGCSMGAYFGLLAYHNESLQQALFLSPVVDMERLIQTMMTCFAVSEERLQGEKEIATPMGQTLYWDDYQYVKAYPVQHWDIPTQLLCGSTDTLCKWDVVEKFARRFGAHLTVMEAGEHFFHTNEQLTFYERWLDQAMSIPNKEASL